MGGAWAADPPRFRGTTLEAALELLREEGLPLVFSSELVPTDLRVEREPATGSRREVAAALLAQHGLGLREVAGGQRLVVVALPKGLGVVWGRVLYGSGEPVPGALVVESRHGRRATTDRQGSFELRALEPGPRKVEVEAPALAPRFFDLDLQPGQRYQLEVEMEPGTLDADSIVVTAEWPWVTGAGLSVHTLGQEDLRALPHFGEDLFRGLESLPGTTTSDGSAHLHVRGGEQSELLVLVDGQELLEPFHLKDFNDALGVIRPATVARVEVITGGFGVQYGDRLTGVLDLVTASPGTRTRGEVALGPLQVEAGASGRSSGPRGAGWLVDGRYGSLEIPFRIADEEENPRFWDLFTKWDQSTNGRGWRVQALLAGDQLDFVQVEAPDDEVGTMERFQTDYQNFNLWGSHQTVIGRNLMLDHRIGGSRLERTRNGRRESSEGELGLEDIRELEMVVLAHEGRVDLGWGHGLHWGAEGRTLEAHYDYRDELNLENPLAAIRGSSPNGTSIFGEIFDGSQLGIFVSDHWQKKKFTAEWGLRFDENTVIDDDHLSPRLSAAWELGPATRLRGAWGSYSQSQRLYELQVEDGETEFAPTERAESWGLGIEHQLSGQRRRPLTFRAEIYRRRVRNPRARWENLFEPVSLAPELEGDRVRIAADRTTAEGLELFLGGSLGKQTDYFLTYTLSRIEDQIGEEQVPRAVDQPHALGIDVLFRGLQGWEMSVAARAHTGWPTTTLSAHLEEGADGEPVIVPDLGPLRGARLHDYYRVDLRATRHWTLSRGELELAIEVRNATNATLERGARFEFEVLPSGEVEVERIVKTWAGPLPNLTLRWRF